MDTLEVGKIVNTHGLRGEVKVISWTDYPEDFEDIEKVYIKRKSGMEELDITNIKYQKNNLILKFKQITSIEEAEKYKNMILLADRDALGELPEGVYYVADLIGCKVITDDDRELGKISDVINTGSNDIYEVSGGEKKRYIPVIDEVVLNVDIEEKKVIIHMIDGLEDL